MLKVPGVGTALSSFMYVSVISHGMLELAIICKTINAYGVTSHKMQNYEIYSDDRHPNIQNIKATIDSLLSQALNTNAVIKITINEQRNYVWIGGNQYSGHFKPNIKSMKYADEAFGKLSKEIFVKNFNGGKK